MSRALRFLFIFYASMMFGVLIGDYLIEHRELLLLWVFTGLSTAWCVMLALVFVLSKEPEFIHSRFWMTAMSLASVSCLSAFFAVANDHERRTLAISPPLILAFLASMASLLGKASAKPKLGRVVVPVLWAVGAALVIASVFLRIATDYGTGDGTGLGVLRLQDHWITGDISVGNGLFFGKRIPWLQPIFGPVGYVFYLFTLVLTATSLVSLGKWRLSPSRMLRSPLLPYLSGAFYVANFWVLVDVYWGWHFDLSQHTWAAALGAMCWLTALLFAVVVAVRIVRGEVDTAIIRASLLFQFPLVLFNLLILPSYFREDYIQLTGLGCLILGLQIQSFVSLFAVRASMLEYRQTSYFISKSQSA